MVYSSNSIKQLQDNLGNITSQSTASSTVAIVCGSTVFTTSSEKVENNTQFYIGSASKHMTAYMLLATLHEKYPEVLLQELLHKKIDLLFPTSDLLQSINKEWVAEVSLLDLLTHRSGLSDYLDSYGDGLTVPKSLNKPIGAVRLLQSISFDSEKKYLYSNSNYLLIGKLIEEISNERLDHVFEKFISLPANMTSSFCPVSGNYFQLKSFSSYTHLAPNRNEEVFIDMANAIGAGSVVSTRDDLVKWGRYLFTSAPNVLRDALLGNYGRDVDNDMIHLGFTTNTTQLGDLIGHQGGIDSFSSFFGYAPQHDTLIIILSNDTADANRLLESMSDWMFQPQGELSLFQLYPELGVFPWIQTLVEENRSLEFAKNYNKQHPHAAENGYGPFALMPYKSHLWNV